MTRKIPFKQIKTTWELGDRVVNGTLSVGCWFPYIKKFLSDREKPGKKRIVVKYTLKYRTEEKCFWL